MIGPIAGLLVANAMVLAVSRALARGVATGIGCIDTLTFLLIRLAVISSIVLVAGLLHLLKAVPLGILAGAALLLLLALKRGRSVVVPELKPIPPALLWGMAALGIRLLAQVWFFSPHVGDALAYHLPKIAEWVQTGRFTQEMGLHPHASFPAGFELIETWWVVFLHHDVLVEMAGVEFLILAFAALVALARHVGMDLNWSMFAGLLFVTTPGLYWGALSCLNDAPAAALVVSTMALVAWRAPFSMVLLTAGLGVGIKATYVYALPGIVVLAFWARKEPSLPPARKILGTGLAALGLAIGLFWYVRNWAWTGNPIYPVGSPGYSQEVVAVQVGPSATSLFRNFADLVNLRLYDNQGALGANVMHMAGWGAASFACGGVALLTPAPALPPRMRRLLLAFVLSLASSLTFIIHDPWCLKYVLYFPALFSIAIPPAARSNPGALLVSIAALILNVFATSLPSDLPAASAISLASQPWRDRTVLRLREAPLEDPAVACLGGYQVPSYLLYGPDLKRRVRYVRSTSVPEAVQDLRTQGVRLLYAWPANRLQTAVVDEGVRTGAFRKIGERLYRLP